MRSERTTMQSRCDSLMDGQLDEREEDGGMGLTMSVEIWLTSLLLLIDTVIVIASVRVLDERMDRIRDGTHLDSSH